MSGAVPLTAADEDRLVEWALRRFAACRRRNFVGRLTVHFDHGVPKVCEVLQTERPDGDLPHG